MPDPISLSHAVPVHITIFLLGYFLGSIPFGFVLTKFSGLGDIRTIGSGNIGTTNVLRTGHKGLAAATLMGDLLKGTLAVLIAYHWGLENAIIAGIAAFLGHLFPVWLRFRGGKGVATYIGVMLGLWWPAAFIFCAVWLYIALFSRYSSFAALTASLALPLILIALGETQFAQMAMLLTALTWIKHRQNIQRLIKGQETPIGTSQ